MSRIAKQALAFVVGLVIMGGLAYWSMAGSFHSLKEAKQNEAIMEVHSTNMRCATYDTTEKCSQTFEIKSNGVYKNLNGDVVKLTNKQLATLRTLIKEADFSQLNPGDGEYCHANVDAAQISYSFNAIADPTWYVPCMSTNAREFPLFNFLEKELGLPIDTRS
jgi:hypothetical protein